MVLSPSREELEWLNNRTSIMNKNGRAKKVQALWKGYRHPDWLTARDVSLGLPAIPWEEGDEANMIIASDTSPHMTLSNSLDTVPGYLQGVPMVVVAQYHSPSEDETAVYKFDAKPGTYTCRRYGKTVVEDAEGNAQTVFAEDDWVFKCGEVSYVEGRWTVYTKDGHRHVEQVASAEGTHYAHKLHTEFVDTKLLEFVWRGHSLRFTSDVVRSNSVFQAHFSTIEVMGEAVPMSPKWVPSNDDLTARGIKGRFSGCEVLSRIPQLPAVSSFQVVRDGQLSRGITYMEEVFSGGESRNAQTQRSRNTAMLRMRNRLEQSYDVHLNCRLVTPYGTTFRDHLRFAWQNTQKKAAANVSQAVKASVLSDAAVEQAHDQQALWFQTRLGLSPELSSACARVTGASTVLEMVVALLDNICKGASWLATKAWEGVMAAAGKVASCWSGAYVPEEITLSALGHAFSLARSILGATGWGKNLIRKRLNWLDGRSMLSDDFRLAHPHVSRLWDWSTTALLCVLTALVEEYLKRILSFGSLFGLIEGLVHVIRLWVESDQDLSFEACGISVAVIVGHFLGHLALLIMPLVIAVPIHAIINFAQSKIGTNSWPLWRQVLERLKRRVIETDDDQLLMDPLVAPPSQMQGSCETMTIDTEDGPIPLTGDQVSLLEHGARPYRPSKTTFLDDAGHLSELFGQPNGGPSDLFVLEQKRLARVPPPFDMRAVSAVARLKDRLWTQDIRDQLSFEVYTPEKLFDYFLHHPVWTRSKKSLWIQRLVDVLDGKELEMLSLFVKKDEILMAKLVELDNGDWDRYLKVRPIHPGSLTSVLVFAVSVPRKESVDGQVFSYHMQTGKLRVDPWMFSCPDPREVCLVYVATTGPGLLSNIYEALKGSALVMLTHGDDLYALRADHNGRPVCVPLDISMCDASCREDNVHEPLSEELCWTARGDTAWIDRCLAAYRKEMMAERVVEIGTVERVVYRPTELKTATGSAITAQLAAFGSSQSWYSWLRKIRDGGTNPADWPSLLIEAYGEMGFETTGEWVDDWIPACLGTFLGGRFLSNSETGRVEWMGESPKVVVAPELRLYGHKTFRDYRVACHVLVLRSNSVLMAHPLYRSILDKMALWVNERAAFLGWDTDAMELESINKWNSYLKIYDPYSLERTTDVGAVPFGVHDYQEVLSTIDDYTAMSPKYEGTSPPNLLEAFGYAVSADVTYVPAKGCFFIDADLTALLRARYPG